MKHFYNDVGIVVNRGGSGLSALGSGGGTLKKAHIFALRT